jgi:rod shape-determining protein MreD
LRIPRTVPLGTGAPSFDSGGPAWYVVAALLGAALLAQSTLVPFVSLRGAAPPLVLLVVFWFAVRSGSARGLAFGLLAGACEDGLTAGSAPAWTFATGAIGALAGRLRGTQVAESRFSMTAAVGLAVLLRYGLFSVFAQVAGHPPELVAAHFHAALWQSAYAAILAVLLQTFVPEARATRESRI